MPTQTSLDAQQVQATEKAELEPICSEYSLLHFQTPVRNHPNTRLDAKPSVLSPANIDFRSFVIFQVPKPLRLAQKQIAKAAFSNKISRMLCPAGRQPQNNHKGVHQDSSSQGLLDSWCFKPSQTKDHIRTPAAKVSWLAGALCPVNHKGVHQGSSSQSVLVSWCFKPSQPQKDYIRTPAAKVSCLAGALCPVNHKGVHQDSSSQTQLVSWCFMPSQPQRITSGLQQPKLVGQLVLYASQPQRSTSGLQQPKLVGQLVL